MGFQLWDRNTGNLIAEFDDQEKALAFVRAEVVDLDARQAELEVERMSLLYIEADRVTARKIAEGHGVLELIMSSAGPTPAV